MNAELKPNEVIATNDRGEAPADLASVFDLVATAPDGAIRLRELILDLAVRGTLLAQNRDDEPVVDLLFRVQRAREELEKGGEIPRTRPQRAPAVRENVAPSAWKAVPLRELAWPQAGFAFKSAEFNEVNVGMPLIRIRDVGVNCPRTFYSGEYRDEFIVKHGEWLVSMDGEFRVCPWLGPPALLNQRVTRLRFFSSEVEPLFVCIALQQQLRELQGTKAYTTVDHLSGKQIAEAIVWLPPTAEQKRIVARVRDLLTLCDSLDANSGLAAAQHARLTSALFEAWVRSESASNLGKNWQQIAEQFDLILDRAEAVDRFEEALIELAVRALLLAQDSNAEVAASPADRLRKAAARMDCQMADPIDENKRLFFVPPSWTWVMLGEVSSISSGVTLGRKKTLEHPVTVPYLRVANVQRGFLTLDVIKTVTIDESEVTRFALKPRDLLITEGGDWDKVGRTAIWRGEIQGCLHQNHIFRVRGVSLEWNEEWVQLYLNSSVARNYFANAAKQTTNLASINSTQLKRCPIPLPPLSEQRRIVARVAELRNVCAELRECLSAKIAVQERLADAALATAVE
jgi:type I restriction enzyme, S subunit